jgi:hypothetical protein
MRNQNAHGHSRDVREGKSPKQIPLSSRKINAVVSEMEVGAMSYYVVGDGGEGDSGAVYLVCLVYLVYLVYFVL